MKRKSLIFVSALLLVACSQQDGDLSEGAECAVGEESIEFSGFVHRTSRVASYTGDISNVNLTSHTARIWGERTLMGDTLPALDRSAGHHDILAYDWDTEAWRIGSRNYWDRDYIYHFTAVMPADAEIDENDSIMTVPVLQQINDSGEYPDGSQRPAPTYTDYLAATADVNASTRGHGETVQLQFRHVLSRITFHTMASYQNYENEVSLVRLQLHAPNPNATANFVFDTTYSLDYEYYLADEYDVPLLPLRGRMQKSATGFTNVPAWTYLEDGSTDPLPQPTLEELTAAGYQTYDVFGYDGCEDDEDYDGIVLPHNSYGHNNNNNYECGDFLLAPAGEINLYVSVAYTHRGNLVVQNLVPVNFNLFEPNYHYHVYLNIDRPSFPIRLATSVTPWDEEVVSHTLPE